MDLIVLAMAKKYADSRVDGLLSGEKTAILADFALSDGGYEAEGNKIGLEVGKTYTITLDSGTYTGICKMLEADGTTLYCIGNAVDVTGIDTGEPYVVFESAAGSTLAFDFNGGTRLTISETIVSIDPKYLPGVCLPVVELNIDALIGEGTFTDAENAALTACIGMPFILKSGNSTVSTSIVMAYIGGGNEHTFYNGNTTLHTNNGGETWTVIIA